MNALASSFFRILGHLLLYVLTNFSAIWLEPYDEKLIRINIIILFLNGIA